ncbi:MAG: hypothetical protein GXP15_09975 [Gammaproteobacteria bacterium]|nr:hypothetical protein [Gammaproteobacteria bacterium]
MTTCPKCPDADLQHTLIAGNLTAHSCTRCTGLLISLVAYRRWREIHHRSAADGEAVDVNCEIPDTRNAITCSRCRTVMIKYRISAQSDRRIDYCASCEDIWLDGGEWELIESLVGSRHLAGIVTRPWQRRIRLETVDALRSDRLASFFGKDFEKIRDLKEWLDEHSAREEILAYLQRREDKK